MRKKTTGPAKAPDAERGRREEGSRRDPTAEPARPAAAKAPAKAPAARDPYARPENEDDDGYDPWSDRPARREPLFERDPWG